MNPYDVHPEKLARLISEIVKVGTLHGFRIEMERSGCVLLSRGQVSLFATPDFEVDNTIAFQLEQDGIPIMTWEEPIEWSGAWTTDLISWKAVTLLVLRNLDHVGCFLSSNDDIIEVPATRKLRRAGIYDDPIDNLLDDTWNPDRKYRNLYDDPVDNIFDDEA